MADEDTCLWLPLRLMGSGVDHLVYVGAGEAVEAVPDQTLFPQRLVAQRSRNEALQHQHGRAH